MQQETMYQTQGKKTIEKTKFQQLQQATYKRLSTADIPARNVLIEWVCILKHTILLPVT